MALHDSNALLISALSVIVQSSETLTKLYPGADCSNRNAIDLLQVALYVIFGHSVKIGPEQIERGKEKKKELKKRS